MVIHITLATDAMFFEIVRSLPPKTPGDAFHFEPHTKINDQKRQN